MNTYTIQIKNLSGVPKQYALFTGKPVITGQVQPEIWSNVFAVAPTPPGQIATFTIYKQYMAMMGTSSGSPKSGVTVSVAGTKPVTLGKLKDNGSVVAGSSVNYITTDLGTEENPMLVPSFADDYLDAAGQPNAFEIQTTGPFTTTEVKNGNWYIGVGSSINGCEGPAAVFAPIPNQSYQIKPINQFWITSGQYVHQTLIDYTMVTKGSHMVDFSTPNAKPTIVVHNTPNGKFVTQI